MLPRIALGLGALLVSAIVVQADPPAAGDEEYYSSMCERAIVNGARRGGVPPEILYAISLTETGRMRNGRLRPWPWAINREGKGHWFKTREEALAFGEQSLADGRRSFDVGCVQINYRWHGHAFPTLNDMFDPEWTATYAAQFLRTLYEDRGNWSEAAGAYHSLTPEYATIYRKRFDRLLAKIDPTVLEGSATQMAHARPLDLQRRGPNNAAAPTQRQPGLSFEERRRQLGPPPEPGPGGVASVIFLPAAGSLLNEERSLLTEGKPLLTAPRGSLY
ncbi:MAG: lytic transglycosylase domain-containing protein [Pseudomonadota bacterium]